MPMRSSAPIPCPRIPEAHLVPLPGEAVDRALEDHIATCPACAVRHLAARRSAQLLASLPALRAPLALAEAMPYALSHHGRQDRALAALRSLPELAAPPSLDALVAERIGTSAKPRKSSFRAYGSVLGAAAALLLLAVLQPKAEPHRYDFKVVRGESLATLDSGHRALIEGITGMALGRNEKEAR